MTNEQFFSRLTATAMCCPLNCADIFEHAHKLVAVAEESKKVYKSGRFDNQGNNLAKLAMALDALEET